MKRILQRIRYEIRRPFLAACRLILRGAPGLLLERWADAALRFRIAVHESLRQRSARKVPDIIPALASWDGREILKRSILEPRAPWASTPPAPCSIPGMLTPAERQYYPYLTRFYSGAGQVVELGPWLGLSTHYLLAGLVPNPAFAGKSIHVFDDFVWRSSWMDKWLAGTGLAPRGNHESFLPLFQRQMAGHLDRLVVRRCKIADYDGNESLPSLEWDRGPIELLIVDCGRPLHVNEAWYRVLSPWFIPDKTLIVMQDWQNCKRVPELFFENTKIFTDGKQEAMDMIHEVAHAGIATFVHRAPRGTA